MKEKSCRCGDSKKRFKYDIGPFYVAECCEAKGYDALGATLTEQVKKTEVKLPVKPGRGRLMDMTVPALKELAKTRNVQLSDDMNKKQIVAELLK